MASSMLNAPGLARARTGTLVLSLAGLLGACASLTPEDPVATRFRADAGSPGSLTRADRSTPQPGQGGGRYKVGAPYQEGGVWYVPAEQPGYDEVGLASWYGDAFNGKKTANGETFDMHAISAAHATLPMPCMVEVTNLDNGRVIQVRLNDRGPYHPGRIIDLSHAAAEQLGYAVKGTTRVRVRYVGPAPLTEIAAPATIALGSRVADFMTPPHPAPRYQIDPPSAADARTPSPVGAVTGFYVVQAGAFSSRATAERVASRLGSAGKASVRPLARGGSTLYRVVVGPWTDGVAAASARSQVAALGFSDARVAAGF